MEEGPDASVSRQVRSLARGEVRALHEDRLRLHRVREEIQVSGAFVGPLPERREMMVRTKRQQAFIARLYARLGFKYIVGWKDVRGYGVAATRCVNWIRLDQPAYINLRDT
jgi:hypothetical protein